MIFALETLVKTSKDWNEQQKTQVLAWLECAKDFGENLDKVAKENEDLKKIIRLMLMDDVDLYKETKETKPELYERARKYLGELAE